MIRGFRLQAYRWMKILAEERERERKQSRVDQNGLDDAEEKRLQMNDCYDGERRT
jgi:hypothetical protein